MPVPKRKRSRARRDSRFANKGIKAKQFSICAHCSEPLLSHTVCKACGYYKGKKVMTTKVERAIKVVDKCDKLKQLSKRHAHQNLLIQLKSNLNSVVHRALLMFMRNYDQGYKVFYRQ